MNEDIYKIISLTNEIEISNFIFVHWMQKKVMNVIFAIFIFLFSPSMSNKLMMYGHTLSFLKKNYCEFFIS